MAVSTQLREAISTPRFATYEHLVGGNNQDDALLLYRMNALLSGMFMFPLQSLEVAFRNVLASQLDVYFGTNDWLINILDPSQPISDPNNPVFWKKEQLKIIDKAKQRYAMRQRLPTQNLIISDLDFSFWTMFLGHHYHRFWPDIEPVFQYRPAQVKRGSIDQEMNIIRRFRNRVAHHEIIVNHPKTPIVLHDNILRVLEWVSPDKAAWTRKYSRVQMVWQQVVELKQQKEWPGF